MRPPKNAARRRSTRSTRRSGLTLLEIVIVVAILSLTLGEISRSLVTVTRLEPTNRETELALAAGTSVLERVRSLPYDEVFTTYNASPADDPDGPGTAPGASFAVRGLSARADDADGQPGRVEFPMKDDELREDVADVELGMPRDLDGDDLVDSADHAANHLVLPLRVVVEWDGEMGVRRIVLTTTIARPE